MCFGPAFSWSVFQDYLQRSEHSPLRKESTVTISAIGTLLFSMLYFAPALARPFFWLHPEYARLMMRVCLAVAIVALIGASFATNAATLVGVVGLVVGLACGIMTSKPQCMSLIRPMTLT
jgi:ABC-type multidrug transport system permease subunit